LKQVQDTQRQMELYVTTSSCPKTNIVFVTCRYKT
jgi:hypothetical protein